MAIKVFFHICAITRAEAVVRNMVRIIQFSGLYDAAEKIYCYISGEEEIIQRIVTYLGTSGNKFTVMKTAPHDTSYERLTLEDIHHHVTETDRILYIHSKGVSPNHQTDLHELQCIDDWCDAMMYYLVRHYRKCLEYLEKYDTVGINLKLKGRDSPCENHWSGNFWWVRGDYFLTLPTKIGPRYYDPEQTFLFVNNPRICEIFCTGKIDHYHDLCQPFKYIDT